MTIPSTKRNQPDEEQRILLLEDANSSIDTIEDALSRTGLVARTERVDTKDEFSFAIREFEPDVILSDPTLAPLSSEAALSMLQDARSTIPLIVVADQLDDQAAVACLRAGAEDLVLKKNLSRLSLAIDTALQVRRPINKLSPRQLEVLRLVTDGRTTREIAEQLSLSVKTVETHRGELTKRLEMKEMASLVRYAVRVGLIPLSGLRSA